MQPRAARPTPDAAARARQAVADRIKAAEENAAVRKRFQERKAAAAASFAAARLRADATNAARRTAAKKREEEAQARATASRNARIEASDRRAKLVEERRLKDARAAAKATATAQANPRPPSPPTNPEEVTPAAAQKAPPDTERVARTPPRMGAPTPVIVRVPGSGADTLPQAAAPATIATVDATTETPANGNLLERAFLTSKESEPSPAAKPAAVEPEITPPVTSEAIAAEPKAPAQNLMETRFETAKNIAPAPVAQVVTTTNDYGYTRTGNAAPAVASSTSSMYSLAALAVAAFLFVGWKKSG